MPPLLERKLRFSDVVFAIDTSPKALRNWLQRSQVSLISPTPLEGGWREFSLADVAVLALTRALVDFGINVEDASNLAGYILSGMQGEEWFEREEASAETLSMFWVNRAVLIAREVGAERWHVKIWNMWQDFPKDFSPACIVLRPEDILRRAVARGMSGAEESGDPEERDEVVQALDRLIQTIRDATPKLDGDPE